MESTHKESGKRSFHMQRLASQIHKRLPDRPVVVWWNNYKYSRMVKNVRLGPVFGAEYQYSLSGADSLESAKTARLFVLSTPEYIGLIGDKAGQRRTALAKALVAAFHE